MLNQTVASCMLRLRLQVSSRLTGYRRPSPSASHPARPCSTEHAQFYIFFISLIRIRGKSYNSLMQATIKHNSPPPLLLFYLYMSQTHFLCPLCYHDNIKREEPAPARESAEQNHKQQRLCTLTVPEPGNRENQRKHSKMVV